MTSRIYIAGCGGMLGEAFHDVFGASAELMCTDIDLNAPWLGCTDFRDFDAYRASVRAFRPDWLFHLGANTDLEDCERRPEEAYRTNTLAVEHATQIANELDIPLLYIGTAGIFDGAKDTYDDWDIPNPLSVYGRSKYAGERHVLERARRPLVCRAGWMMGGGPAKDKKFVHKIMAQLREGRRELHVVRDKSGTPTYTCDFARNVQALMSTGAWGLYNMACTGMTGRVEVAREIIDVLGLQEQVVVHEVDSAYFQQQYFATRPPSERLVNRKLDLRGLNLMRDWRVALREYLAERYANYL